SGVVSSFGAWVSLAQMRIIESRASKIVLAMDDDEAGHDSTQRLLNYFAPKMPTWVFNYEALSDEVRDEVKDPGDMEWDEIALGLRESVFATRLPRERRVVRR
ncbi:MAG: toprim domain-containing protein, partial [Intrasporangiaceae bacterium]|nr:toprim domain-containing protein [Intrasporangiaceae bacterium]